MTSPAEPSSAPLIKTKISAPQLPVGLVARPQLLSQLGESSSRALTLICAPAGYGKTTLLINWIKEFKKTHKPNYPLVCWLSLDQEDNEPIRFMNYLVAAFETAGTGISDEVSTMLRSNAPPPIRTLLTVLINDLVKLAKPIYLVLDDYQFISNKVIQECTAFLLDHLPTNVHLAIATRSDPPFPMARLRARGQLTEIRADDLRFSYEETNHFFNQVMRLGLTTDDMTRLEERTEGWIAGLQMAGIALKSISQTKTGDTSLFVKNFAGSNRYILDYLVEEVLSRQPEDIQDFLLQTSILENLTESLCDTVVGIPGKSKNEDRNSQRILNYLERSNLFLVSQDSERQWYRYHHLFADLLRARLEQRLPERVPELHARASEWYEQNQRFPEAVNHALDARQYDRACGLIEKLVEQRSLAQNGIGLLMGWILRLPPDIVITRPWLYIVQATSAMFINNVEIIEPLLKTAEQSIQLQDRSEQFNNWKGQIASLRAFVADVHNNVPGTIEMVHQALEFLPPDNAATRSFAKYLLGRAYFISGDFPKAIATLTENVHECMEANVTNIIAPSLSTLSKVYRIKGKLRESVERLKEGQNYIEKYDPRRVTVSGVAFIGLANALREWNDLDEAEKIIRRALELCEPWVNPSSTCGCYTMLARVLLSLGNLPAAEEALHLAEEAIRGRSPLPDVICDLDAVRVGFWLASHQHSRATQWVQEFAKDNYPSDTFSIPKEQNEITLARGQIAEGKLVIALQLLKHLAIAAGRGGRMGHLIEIQILQALAFHAMGDQKQAFEMFQKALALGEPEGYLRTFIDEGEPLQNLLLAYVHSSTGKNIAYAQKLLTAFPSPGMAGSPKGKSSNLVEPLTAREIEVLQAMAEGLSNHLIAEKLIIAEGTVKFYVHTVLEKLGVHNRTRAVIEAKKQKII